MPPIPRAAKRVAAEKMDLEQGEREEAGAEEPTPRRQDVASAAAGKGKRDEVGAASASASVKKRGQRSISAFFAAGTAVSKKKQPQVSAQPAPRHGGSDDFSSGEEDIVMIDDDDDGGGGDGGGGDDDRQKKEQQEKQQVATNRKPARKRRVIDSDDDGGGGGGGGDDDDSDSDAEIGGDNGKEQGLAARKQRKVADSEEERHDSMDEAPETPPRKGEAACVVEESDEDMKGVEKQESLVEDVVEETRMAGGDEEETMRKGDEEEKATSDDDSSSKPKTRVADDAAFAAEDGDAALCRFIAEQEPKATKPQLLAGFIASAPKWARFSKTFIGKRIGELAAPQRRSGVRRWWPKPEHAQNFLPKQAEDNQDSSAQEQAAPAEAATPLSEEDQKKVEATSEWLKEIQAKLEAELELCVELKPPTSSADTAGLATQLESADAAAVLARLIQGRRGTLAEEAERVRETWLPDADKIELEQRLALLAERKAHGVKDKAAIANADTRAEAGWRWEVANLALLPADAHKPLAENRRRLAHLSRRATAASRLLKSLAGNASGKLAKRVAREEEAVQKLMREDLLQQQKAEQRKAKEEAKLQAKEAKEAEKAKAKEEKEKEKEKAGATPKSSRRRSAPDAGKRSPRLTPLTQFFKKVAPAAAAATGAESSTSSSPRCSSSASPAGVEPSAAVSAEQAERRRLSEAAARIDAAMTAQAAQALDVWLDHLRAARARGTGERPRLRGQRRGEREAAGGDDGDVAEVCGIESDAVAANRAKKKLFQFHGTYRPPYFGTFRRRGATVAARRPLAREAGLDYAVDSDEEWEEEPEDAESLADSEKDAEEAEEGLDYQDGWLLEDDVVEYGSAGGGASEDDEDEDEEGGEGGAARTAEGQRVKRKRGLQAGGGVRQRYQVGVVFDEDKIREGARGETAKHLLRYAVAPLPNSEDLTEAAFPIAPPTAEDILRSVLPPRKRKRPAEAAAAASAAGAQAVVASPSVSAAEAAAKLASAFPADEVGELVAAVRGSPLNIGGLVATFQTEQRKRFALAFSRGGATGDIREATSKRVIKAKIQQLAVRGKRSGDDAKRRWRIRGEEEEKAKATAGATATEAPTALVSK